MSKSVYYSTSIKTLTEWDGPAYTGDHGQSLREKLKNRQVNTDHELYRYCTTPRATHMICHNNPLISGSLLTTAVWYKTIKHLPAQVHMINHHHHYYYHHCYDYYWQINIKSNHSISHYNLLKRCHSPPRSYRWRFSAIRAAGFLDACAYVPRSRISPAPSHRKYTQHGEESTSARTDTCSNTHGLAHVF